MTQIIFKCFADLLHSSILSNQERIGLHYSLSVHFFILILERGLHYKHKLHKLLPFDLREGTPLTCPSFFLLMLERGLHFQELTSHKPTLFKLTCLNYNTQCMKIANYKSNMMQKIKEQLLIISSSIPSLFIEKISFTLLCQRLGVKGGRKLQANSQNNGKMRICPLLIVFQSLLRS